MAATLVGSARGRTEPAGTSHTITSINVGSANFLIARFRAPGGGAITSPAFNSDAMTSAGAAVGDLYTFYLANPDTGSGYNLTLSSANFDRVYYTLEWWTVDNASDPVDSYSTFSGSSGSQTTGSLTCPSGGAISAGIEHEFASAFSTSDATLIGDYGFNGTGSERRVAHAYRTTTGAVTFTPQSSFQWRISALVLKGSGGGGGGGKAAPTYYSHFIGAH